MDRTVLDLWVGIFVASGIAALFVLALKVGNASTTCVMPYVLASWRPLSHRTSGLAP